MKEKRASFSLVEERIFETANKKYLRIIESLLLLFSFIIGLGKTAKNR